MRLLLPLLILLAAPASAQDPVEVDSNETRALVRALRGKVLEGWEHDTLLDLGESAKGSEDPLDRLYSGLALVYADRPDLGMPLVERGLDEVRLGPSDALRALLFLEIAGQDGLVRQTVRKLKLMDPAGGARLENSVDRPLPLEVARKRAGSLRGLQVTEVVAPLGELGERIGWLVEPEGATKTVVWLPAGARGDRAARRCQDPARLRAAAAVARGGYRVLLPGLRGCDGSAGVYRGRGDAAEDVAALLEVLEVAQPILVGFGDGASLALSVSSAVPSSGLIAVGPRDPASLSHLTRAAIAALQPDLSGIPAQSAVADAGWLEPQLIEAGHKTQVAPPWRTPKQRSKALLALLERLP